MPPPLAPFDLPGAPDDVAHLLERHADRVNHALRALHRRVPNVADYTLAVFIDNPKPDGRRRVTIRAIVRADAITMPGLDLIAPLLADAAPEGMLHLATLADHWQSLTLVPLPRGTMALH